MLRRGLILLIGTALILSLGCGKEKVQESAQRLIAAGRYEEAIAVLSRAVQENPSDPDLHYSLGLAYAGAGRYEEALNQFKVALSFAPDRTDIQYEMAKAAWKLGRRLVPIKTFLRILRDNPTPEQIAEIKELAAERHPVKILTNASYDSSSPVFSPDGSKLAFIRTIGARNVLILMDLSDGSERQLTPENASDMSPSFSPDGSYIFVSSTPYPPREGAKAKLVRVNLITGKREVVLDWENDVIRPSLSPDGRSAVFESFVDDNWEIFKVDLETHQVTRLTNNKANDMGAKFSPDGLKIVFSSDRDGNFEIYEMDSDGMNQVRLTTNMAVDVMPVFSPDGESIAFVSDRDGNEEIYLMDADGSNQRRLTNYREKDITPCFSPDGKTLAFASTRKSSYLQINLMDLTREITKEELIKHLEYLASISFE